MKKVFAAALLALLAAGLRAEDIRVVVPYVGVVNAAVDDYGLDGSGLMEGLYLQWVNPSLFQANAFFYYAADVIGAPVIGGHLIADFYPWPGPFGKPALGAGIEALQPRTSSDVQMGPMTVTTEVTPTVTAPYLRAGHYFYLGSQSLVSVSVFPWAGAEYDIVRVKVSFDPAIAPDSETDDETFYGIAGIGVSATIMHFVELQAKYKATFNADDFFNTFDAMANLYFTRHWGVSYRFKYMQSSSGPMSYHIGGIAYAF